LPSSITRTHPLHLAVLGAGRLGNALAGACASAGLCVAGPYGRDQDPYAEIAFPDVVLLCVPDAEIAGAAAQFPDAQLLGHCSGASGLDLLGSHEGFSLHPLISVTAAGADFAGVGAAVDATSPEAERIAHELAEALGMRAFGLAGADRGAYHAAASIASNFLITLEAAAERLAATTGLDRELLVPLVRASVENWAALGPERALTGPVARGDRDTVARQRAAVVERTPELLALFDAMVDATAMLAADATGLPA
jgi:predicted short-subunit dehydrogenase-like oxidoreductase (DUF2520 family)